MADIAPPVLTETLTSGDGSVTLQRFSVVPLVFGKEGPNVDISSLVNVCEDIVGAGKDQELFYDCGVKRAVDWVLCLRQPQVFPLKRRGLERQMGGATIAADEIWHWIDLCLSGRRAG